MKKIGILTLPLTSRNYGGILQAYALSTYLKEGGYEVEVLDRRFDRELKNRIAQFANSIIASRYVATYNSYYQLIDRFVKQRVPTSKSIWSKKDLDKYVESLDVLVTGSDQVWRPLYSKSIFQDLFLNFKKHPGQKKISYAASFGTDKWDNPELKSLAKSYLKDFDGVSVREDSGVNICKEVFGVSGVEHNIDPTLLLDAEHYLKLIKKAENVRNNLEDRAQITAYILDRSTEKQNFINSVAKSLDMEVSYVGVKEKFSRKNYGAFVNKQCDSVEEWLTGFSQGDFIVTDSFHGVVFSIIFQKNFIAIGNESRGLGRFNSLLRLFDLTDRLVSLQDEIPAEMLRRPIDFTAVKEELANQRQKSARYFGKFLENFRS